MNFREKLHLAPGLGLIFDLDGVIIDSMPFHQRAWQRYLEVTGIGSRDSLEFMHGQRNEEIVRALPPNQRCFTRNCGKADGRLLLKAARNGSSGIEVVGMAMLGS